MFQCIELSHLGFGILNGIVSDFALNNTGLKLVLNVLSVNADGHSRNT